MSAHLSMSTRAKNSPHDVTSMIAELGGPHTSLDIPKHAGHVPRTCNNLPVAQESTTAEVPRMRRELLSAFDLHALLLTQIVDGADVVETTARNEVAGGCVGAGHDPAGPEGDGVHFVGGVGVPDDEFTILGGGDEVPLVCHA